LNFLNVFGEFDFAIRDAMVLCLVALAVYLLLNAGIFAVPQIGLMAVGSYSSAMLSLEAKLPFPVALLAGGLAGLLCGLVIALLLGRLNGIYLAIATIAFSEIVVASVLIIPGTGGAQGLVAIPRDANDFYIVGCLAAAIAVIIAVNRSRIGMAIVAIREDRLMASHQGINVFSYRLGLFAASGLISGLAGGLSVHMSGFVEPGQFSFDLLTQLISMVVLGGMTYVYGPIVGAVVILGLPHLYTGLNDYQLLFNGILIVVVISFAPKGIIGALGGLLGRRTRGPAAIAVNPSPSGQDALAATPVTLEPTGQRKPPMTQPAGKDIDPSSDPAIAVSDVSVAFGGNLALRGASLEVRPGELLGLIGPNGSGKTTMLNVISGIYKPNSGEGRLLGVDVTHLWGQPHKLARLGIARTFQTIRLIDDYSVEENVLIGLSQSPNRDGTGERKGADRREITQGVLRRLGLSDIANVQAGWLPYGVRRRVEIARAVVCDPKVLLLDEPTAGMNAEETAEVFRTIALLQATGMAVIIVEHDVDMMGKYCDRLVVLDFGQVLASGDPATVLKTKEVISAYVGGTA
jgi:branched-chain amino acid transport system permease protein